MFNSAKPARDKFTFSLDGMAAINSFAVTTVVPNDRINRAWDERLSNTAQAESDRKSRPRRALWLDALLAR